MRWDYTEMKSQTEFYIAVLPELLNIAKKFSAWLSQDRFRPLTTTAVGQRTADFNKFQGGLKVKFLRQNSKKNCLILISLAKEK